MFKSLSACALSSSTAVGTPDMTRSTSRQHPFAGSAARQFRRMRRLRSSSQVVNYALENNCIGDGWNCLEEVTRQKARPVGNALAPKMIGRCLGASRKIERRRAKIWVRLCECPNQLARTASDVQQVRNPAKIVCSEKVRCHEPCQVRHCGVEDAHILRVSGHQVKAAVQPLDTVEVHVH